MKSPPQLDWRGKCGAFSLIHAYFPNISSGKIMHVVNDTAYCKDRNKIYNGQIKTRQHKGPCLIQPGGVHERMLVDCIETEVGVSCVRES